MIIKKATPEAVPAIIMFYAYSGGGKTNTALKFAQGLKGDKRIGFVDTENKRGSHYAKEFDFDKIDLTPPFTSQRYLEAIRAFEDTKDHSVIIVDSISHEWEGTGGVLEQVAVSEQRSGKQGLHNWIKPKYYHGRLMQHLTQSPCHIIFCCRAKEPSEQTKVNGKTQILKGDMMPIQQGEFMNEMLVAFQLANKGEVQDIKWSNNDLKKIYEPLRFSQKTIDHTHGVQLMDWITKSGTIDLDLRQMKQACRVAATKGTQSLDHHFKSMPIEMKNILKEGVDDEFKKEMRALAEQADVMNEEKTTEQSEPLFNQTN